MVNSQKVPRKVKALSIQICLQQLLNIPGKKHTKKRIDQTLVIPQDKSDSSLPLSRAQGQQQDRTDDVLLRNTSWQTGLIPVTHAPLFPLYLILYRLLLFEKKINKTLLFADFLSVFPRLYRSVGSPPAPPVCGCDSRVEELRQLL